MACESICSVAGAKEVWACGLDLSNYCASSGVSSQAAAPYDIFISYSTVNEDIARGMKQHLSARGLRCWKAPDAIEPGESWPGAIIRALNECPIVVLIWTKESMESWGVLEEITNAHANKKKIIVYRVQDIELRCDFKYFLARVQWLDAHPDFEQSFEVLADSVLRILRRYAQPSLPGALQQDVAARLDQPVVPATAPPPAMTAPAADSGRQESDRSDRGKFLAQLRAADIFASDREIKNALGWGDQKFDKVKNSLLADRLILAGSGRGGASALPTPALLQLTDELSHEHLPGSVFVNIGEAREEGNTARDWGACKTFGFVSAGGGTRWINDMQRIKPGAIIFAYTSGSGYVGMGTAIEAAVPVAQFRVDGVPLREKISGGSSLFHDYDDVTMCEWLVRVRWDKLLDRSTAIYRNGLFVYVATSCRIKDAITVHYLRSQFGALIEAPVITEADCVA